MKDDSLKELFKKVFGKNYLKLYQLAWVSSKKNPSPFLSEIFRLRTLLEIPDNRIPLDPAKYGRGCNFENIIESANSLVNMFWCENENKLDKFYEELQKTRRKLRLGKEWIRTITRAVIANVFLPPAFSIYCYENKESDTIIFEINKDTTKADLILAWKHSEQLRKKLFGKAKGTFPHDKTIKNFNAVASSLYDKIFNKKQGALEQTESEQGKQIGYKQTDSDFVGDYYRNEADNSIKADKKRVSRLRTARSRIKKAMR